MSTNGDAGFRHRMGVHRLAPAEWLELDHPEFATQRAQKEALLSSEMANDLLAVNPEADEACQELLALVLEEFELQQKSVPDPAPELHPIDAAARLVREDLCLHLPIGADDELMLVAASVCFPTRWTLREKMGRTIDCIHDPVPGYAVDVGRQVSNFLRRLPDGPGVWRRNWSLLGTSELCLPGHHRDLPIADTPQKLWYRSERQTLRRLPISRGVVFTIGIDVQPLAEFRHDRPAALELAEIIEALPEGFASYKGLRDKGPDVVRYLREGTPEP